jgi:Ca2+-binding EF-hand superfamily protein
MRTYGIFFWGVYFCIGILPLNVISSFAQNVGPSEAMIKEAYQTLLSSTDTNKDGKISLSECMAISKDKKKAEKDCKYWDANSDGIITEEEYVKQVKKIMK